MKKLSLAILLGSALGANAAMYQAPTCDAMNITADCVHGWDVGADLLYLQTQTSQLSNLVTFGVKGDWGFGFRLEGSYHFGHGHDVNINWQHFSKERDTERFLLDDDDEVEIIDAAEKPTFDVVNLEMGHQFGVGEQWRVRLHGGLQYAKLVGEVSGTIDGALDSGETVRKGWGPRVGIDLMHHFSDCVSLFAQGAVGLLKTDYDATDTPLQNSIPYTSLEADMRLGAAYTKAMDNGELTVRGGWQSNYYGGNAREIINIGTISWDGFFLGVKWLGNA